MPIILCAPLAYTELVIVADAASGEGEPSEKIRETADARFGSLQNYN